MSVENRFGKKRTAFAILGFLARGPKSGYDINRSISSSTGYFWKESFGQIYPILKKLESEGWIHKDEAELTGKRPRQKYAITPPGLDALQKWIADKVEPNVTRNEMLLKLFFGRLVEPEILIRHIHEHRARTQDQLTIFENYKASFSSRSLQENPDLKFFLIPLNHGIATYGAVVRWCDETLAMLEDETSDPARSTLS
ncbi:MAG: PadR family transcriptional regulator [Sphingopyxis sp.]|uniref:PadR family transcriptional regulator n=1 Tax=Sphingopyxis sp. TaxID=1908224 RepID=UPI002ABA84AE|nr:PadR family transcriptional regulator [Sphingopyxis sp.]MDZ3833624.1 PadR family transcriptional regulator [Sphingopyxis sp.]